MSAVNALHGAVEDGTEEAREIVGERLKKLICFFSFRQPLLELFTFSPRVYYNNMSYIIRYSIAVCAACTIKVLEIERAMYTHRLYYSVCVYNIMRARVCNRTVKTTCARGKMRLSCLRQTRARPWEYENAVPRTHYRCRS